MKYNIHAAIKFRSEGFTDWQGNPTTVTFKESVRLAKDEQFMFGEEYPEEAIMHAASKRASGVKFGRAEWQHIQHYMREHYRRMSIEDSIDRDLAFGNNY